MGWTCRGRNFCCSYIPFNLWRSRFSRKTLISGTGPACFWGVYSPLEIIKTRVRFAFHPLPSKPSLCKSQPPLKFKMCVTVCNWLTEWSLQTLFSSLSCLRNRQRTWSDDIISISIVSLWSDVADWISRFRSWDPCHTAEIRIVFWESNSRIVSCLNISLGFLAKNSPTALEIYRSFYYQSP